MPKKNGPQKSSMFHQSKERHFACAAERLHIEKSPIYRCSIVLTRGGCAMLDDGMGLSLIDVSPISVARSYGESCRYGVCAGRSK